MKETSRSDLPLEALVEDYLVNIEEEDGRLFKSLSALEGDGRRELGGVLGRFDLKRRGVLDAQQRLFAGRVLLRLRKPTSSGLLLVNKILDYLDLNANSVIEENELDLCVEILELFARADSDNDTLSELELEMLYAVLRNLDDNNNRVLDPKERATLRRALNDPESFVANERASNPLLREVLSRR